MKSLFQARLFHFLLNLTIFFLMGTSHAGIPVWTFTPNPNYPPTVSIASTGTATIQYTITNQSSKSHTLTMTPIPGINQVTTAGNCPNPFILGYQQSCSLTLQVNGSALNGNIIGGPVVCQIGSTLQCYQPSAEDSLNVMLIPTGQYLITPSAGPNGTISPNTPQVVNSNSNLSFIATPNTNYQVDQWLVDGGLTQTGGTSYTLSSIIANHSVEVTFTQAGTIYAGATNGIVYFSRNNGLSWTATTAPSTGGAVNSVFATSSTLYAGSEDGYVYYSQNNGVGWNQTTSPDNSAVNSVFVKKVDDTSIIYAGLHNGKIYHTTDGVNWSATATDPSTGHAVNSIDITGDGTIYVGSEDGNVYFSTDNGTTWTTIVGPENDVAIKDVFATDTSLYVNTADQYLYKSPQLRSNVTWTRGAQISYSLFVSTDESISYAGTQSGYIFSLITGNELGFITYTQINSIFFLGLN